MSRNQGNGRTAIITRTVNVDFPQILPGTSQTVAIANSALGLTASDYLLGSTLIATPQGGIEPEVVPGPHTFGPGGIGLTLGNMTGAPVDPAARDWAIAIINLQPGL